MAQEWYHLEVQIVHIQNKLLCTITEKTPSAYSTKLVSYNAGFISFVNLYLGIKKFENQIIFFNIKRLMQSLFSGLSGGATFDAF